MQKQKMTLRDVCIDLRLRGAGMTQKTVADGIESGSFPFGKVLSVTNGRRHILILRRDYETWADKYLGPIQQAE